MTVHSNYFHVPQIDSEDYIYSSYLDKSILKSYFKIFMVLGELAGSPFVELNGYELDETKLPRVIHAINQALTYIHTNFQHLKQTSCYPIK